MKAKCFREFLICFFNVNMIEIPYVLFSELRTMIQRPDLIEKHQTFLCGCCKRPLKICGGRVDGIQQFHFKHIHVPGKGECDYYEGIRYSEEQVKAMLF